MKFVIITHAEHHTLNDALSSYGPYVREMNLWLKYVDEVVIVAPIVSKKISAIDLPYEHLSVKIKKVPAISLTSFFQICRTVVLFPFIFRTIFISMRQADHIHLRCPGNIGLIGCVVQLFFPKKTKTAKYAGNWDPKAKQPLSYRMQKWILSNTFLTRNMTVLVYGEWPKQTKNIKPFFTASYSSLKAEVNFPSFKTPFQFIFVGTLSSGKQPLYAIKLVENLLEEGIECRLDLYGEGEERKNLETYLNNHNLNEHIKLHGNQTSEIIENAYKSSDFLILPSKSEGWPKVVAEAMFWGVIPLATKTSCVPWMLDYGKRGVLLEMKLSTDIECISKLLKDIRQLKDMSQNAQKWSQQYTLESFEKEIKKLLQ